MSCFAAGVFLATCLLDLFPDAHGELSSALVRMQIYTAYPFTEFVVVVGFLLIFLVEQVILARRENNQSGETEPLLVHESVDSLNQSYSSIQHDPQPNGNGPIENFHAARNGLSDINAVKDDEDATSNEVYVDPSSHSVIRSIMLLLALSLHSVFEGLAVGLQPTTDSVLEIFLPVALHKSILAFALGLNLTQSKLSVTSIVRSNLVFAVTSPIGIAIGIVITDVAPDSGMTAVINGAIQAIACGTFLFVVFFEILPHEFMARKRFPSRLLKTLFLVLGFATVSSLLFMDPDVIKPNRLRP